MYLKTISITAILFLLISCSGQHSNQSGNVIKSLEAAENEKDIDQIKSIFHEDAIFYITDLMPIKGRASITSLYEFVFSRDDVESVVYTQDSIIKKGNNKWIYGFSSTIKTGLGKTDLPFMAVLNESGKIIEISYGSREDLLITIPEWMKPTGTYGIGLKNFYYDKDKTETGRLLAYQIWYPTAEVGEKLPFRTTETIEGMSRFLGFPIFAISYFSEIESNTILDARPLSDGPFPVLVYNHGYGGFSQVYQSVFEELVSHGYIVVSVAHQDESALFFTDNYDVISNSPENEFYTKRAPELNGGEIGQWQSTILSSNSLAANKKAYTEMLKLTPLHNESTRLWEQDTRSVISKLKELNASDSEFKGIFDFESLGIFGHSLGGATAGQMCAGNTMFKAGINLDGFQFGELHDQSLSVPFMFVSSNREEDRYLRALTFMDNAKNDCYQVAIKGFSHDNFTDLKYVLEGDRKAIELQRDLIKTFFDKYVKGITADIKALEKSYEELAITSN